jgi:hypothetical protein
MDQEIAEMRQEVKDLEEAIEWQDPPLDPRTRGIAEAKIATLRGQIAALTPRLGQPAPPVRMNHSTDQSQRSPTAPLDDRLGVNSSRHPIGGRLDQRINP